MISTKVKGLSIYYVIWNRCVCVCVGGGPDLLQYNIARVFDLFTSSQIMIAITMTSSFHSTTFG